MIAPAHSVVSIYVDFAKVVELNDIIETATGRRYAVLEVRVQKRGKHAGRQHLKVIVLAKDEGIGPNSVIHSLRWYKR